MPSAIPFGQSSITVGGYTFTDVENLIILHSAFSASVLSGARKSTGNAGYTPAGGKSFYVKLIEISLISASENDGQLVYADNDTGLISAGALTNAVYEGGAGSTYPHYRYGGSVAIPQYFFLSQWVVPAGKYLYFRQNSGTASCTARIFGYER